MSAVHQRAHSALFGIEDDVRRLAELSGFLEALFDRDDAPGGDAILGIQRVIRNMADSARAVRTAWVTDFGGDT